MVRINLLGHLSMPLLGSISLGTVIHIYCPPLKVTYPNNQNKNGGLGAIIGAINCPNSPFKAILVASLTGDTIWRI